MKRSILAALAVAVVGCSNSGSSGNDMGIAGADMSAPGGQTTIAKARMGNVTGPITVTAVVIGLPGDPADAKEWYIQDPQGGPYSGVDVYCNKTAKSNPCPMAIATPALHDLIQITGTLSAYKGKLELNPTAQMTMMANATPPAPATATAADVVEMSTNAGLRGQIVKVTGTFTVDDVTPMALYDTQCQGDGGVGTLCMGCKPPTYSGFQVNDGASHEIFVENTFYASEHLQSSPECASTAPSGMQITTGKKFSVIGGILDVDPYAPATTVAVEPTTDSDYTLQ